MTNKAPDDVVRALSSLPAGTMTGAYEARRYVATKSVFNGGKSLKLVAEELGGGDYISLNLYLLDAGARLYPCEMSAAKVTSFVLGFQPEPSAA